jgi:acyl-coenzyme A synthetase/AMP-(fatty) acid ligase
VLDGPINAEAFKTYVRAELVKTLKTEDIVVLDNLNSHKGKAVRAIAKFKLPKRVIFAGELPRNAMGKVQKNLLRDNFKDLFAARAGK